MSISSLVGSVQIDPFFLYRRCLAVFCLIYTLIRLAQSLSRYVSFLYRPGRQHRLLRDYLAVHVLRIPLRPFAGQLAQIGALVIVLVALLWLHRIVR